MNLTGNILQQLFPERCLHCEERLSDAHLLCAVCANTLRKGPVDTDIVAGMRRRYALIYDAAAKSLFAAAKFSDRRRARQLLVEIAAENLKGLVNDSALFIEIPSSRPFLHGLLRRVVPRRQILNGIFAIDRTGSYKSNKLLKESDRFQRIAATLTLSGKNIPEAGHYVICDDVYTTGATMGHAAWLLRQAGVEADNLTMWSLMFRERQVVEKL